MANQRAFLALCWILGTSNVVSGQYPGRVEKEPVTEFVLAATAENRPANSRISPVTLGFTFDSRAQGLRQITGIPGAARADQVLPVGVRLREAVASPNQAYMLATAELNSQTLLFSVGNETISVERLINTGPAPTQISLSPTGATAALFRQADDAILVLRGLPDEPFVTGTLTTSTVPGRLTALSVSDDGRSVVAAFRDGAAGAVYRLAPSGRAVLLAATGPSSSVAFAPSSHDVLIADRERNLVYRAPLTGGADEVYALAGEEHGISGPAAVAVSADGRRVFVANSVSSTVSIIDEESRAASQIPCICTPTQMNRLSLSRSIFRLTDVIGTSFWLLDTTVAEARIVFVPVAGHQRLDWPNGSERPMLPSRARSRGR